MNSKEESKIKEDRSKNSIGRKLEKKAAPKKRGIEISKKRFNPDQFQRLCEIQCTKKEIAYILGMNEVTLGKNVKDHYGKPYLEVYNHFISNGKAGLRRTQFKRAIEDESDKMLIFLGKQFLGQSDKTETLNVHQIEALFAEKTDEEIKAALDAQAIPIEVIKDTTE